MIDLQIKLPENYLKSEIRDGFQVSEKRKEIWAVELDLLNKLSEVCKNHHITYFAYGGTLLGTIRSNGFIPWDDDIDVIMSRKEYMRLCAVAVTEFQYPYFFQTEYTDPGSLRGHAQLRNSNTTAILKNEAEKKLRINQGIFIDIFVFDNFPSDREEQLKLEKHANKLKERSFNYADISTRYSINKTARTQRWYKKCLYNLIGKHFTFNIFYWLWEKSIQQYDRKDTDYIADLIWWYFEPRLIWKKSWFESSVMMKFEFIEVPVPIGYDEFLTKFYNDWRTPVRKPTLHGDILFDTCISYKEYLNQDNPLKMQSDF